MVTLEKFELIKKALNVDDQHMYNKGMLKIHPDFRIVALGEPSVLQTTGNWLSPEVLSLFLFHETRMLTKEEELHIITSKVGIDLILYT